MKLIIAGTRFLKGVPVVSHSAVSKAWTDDLVFAMAGFCREHGYPFEIVSGAAEGVDRLGEVWAGHYGIPVKRFPAKWSQYGRMRAGAMRNMEMATYADALLALWDGKSPGTRNMIQQARARSLIVVVRTVVDGIVRT